MIFKIARAMFKDVQSEVRVNGPVKMVLFHVYCTMFIAAGLFLLYVYSLGLPEVLTWIVWGVGIFPFLFLYALWDENIPKKSTDLNDLRPKVWYFRSRQIWPRQK